MLLALSVQFDVPRSQIPQTIAEVKDGISKEYRHIQYVFLAPPLLNDETNRGRSHRQHSVEDKTRAVMIR
jgi:hypothetical protein